MNDNLSNAMAYYSALLKQSKNLIGSTDDPAKHITHDTVTGLQQAVDVLQSIQAGAMTIPEAHEYVNDPAYNNLPGIAWARKAVKQAQQQHRRKNHAQTQQQHTLDLRR